MGRYFDGTVEIDIMATSKDKKQIILGECKFKNTPFDLREFNALKAKLTNSNVEIYYYLFSKSGFTDDLRRQESDNTKLINIDNLF